MRLTCPQDGADWCVGFVWADLISTLVHMFAYHDRQAAKQGAYERFRVIMPWPHILFFGLQEQHEAMLTWLCEHCDY